MTGLSVLAAGALVGVRHALEPDHLAAVATLVDEDTGRTGVVGASWGVGHALPVVALGLGFIGLGVELPATVTTLFEAIVGVVLLVLGARLLRRVAVARGGLAARTRHDHGSGPHAHLSVGDVSLGATHVHLDGDSFLVGVLHGLAGSGALVVLLVAVAPSPGAALGFLAGFCALSVLTMAGVAVVWGRALGTAAPRHLETAAGLFGVALGAAMLAEQVAAVGVF